MVSSNLLRFFAAVLGVILLVDELAAAPALYTDYDNLRDLYELLLRNEGLSSVSRYPHQMERKGGRSPSLRLRFGRRADPVWEGLTSVESAAGPESPAN